MKKVILIVMAFLVINSVAYAQRDYYYDDGYYDYDERGYMDTPITYDYGYEAALPYLNSYRGSLYYWRHPYANLYFIAVGSRIFIIPALHFNRYLYRYPFRIVSMNHFIELTCFGLPYYDNYMRFNFYYDYYRRNRYNRSRNLWLKGQYRKYYSNRHRDRSYYRHRDRVYRQRTVIKKNLLRGKGKSTRWTGNSRGQRVERQYSNRYSKTNRHSLTKNRSSRYTAKGSSVRKYSSSQRSGVRNQKSRIKTKKVQRGTRSRKVGKKTGRKVVRKSVKKRRY